MHEKRKENVLTGILGAFLGSLLGAAMIVLFGQSGYINSVSGAIMALCTIKGYELLGRQMSRKGVVVACILILIMTYMGYRLNYVISISLISGEDLLSSFQTLDYLLESGYMNAADYWGSLVPLYLFALLGAAAALHSAFQRAIPVSMPPAAKETTDQEVSPSQDSWKFFPCSGSSWTKAMRFSLSAPIFLSIAAVAARLTLFSGAPILPGTFILAGTGIAMIIIVIWMLILITPYQNLQYLFVYHNSELWRIDLMRLNQIEPFRFTQKTGYWKALCWTSFTDEEKQRAANAIQRAIHSICADEVMPDSLLRRFVLYLPNPKLEKETKWLWKISYSLNGSQGNRRKMMNIAKIYFGFSPTPDAEPLFYPPPYQWKYLLYSLSIIWIFSFIGNWVSLLFV